MVPPPCSMRAAARSWIGAGISEGAGIGPGAISGVAGLGSPGVCIGRKVIRVVVFRLFRMLCAALSIVCVRLLEIVFWVLLVCLVERQEMVIRSMMATAVVRVMLLFFMVVVFDSKGNTFGESVQWKVSVDK